MRSDKGGGWRRRRGEGPPTFHTRFSVSGVIQRARADQTTEKRVRCRGRPRGRGWAPSQCSLGTQARRRAPQRDAQQGRGSAPGAPQSAP